MVPKVAVVRHFSLVEMELENTDLDEFGGCRRDTLPASVTDLEEQLQGPDAAAGVQSTDVC